MFRLLPLLIIYSLFSLFGETTTYDTDSYKLNIEPFAKKNHFTDPDWYNWGGSIVKGTDKSYYLFYSRWPRKFGFLSWLTHSEVAVASSKSPSGPWKYQYTALKGRKGKHWDAVTAHNPKIKKFGKKYYLYYISTKGDLTEKELQQTAKGGYRHKNWSPLRNAQRTGVAVSNNINGPWKRMKKALVEPTAPLYTITVNPAVTQMADGRYLLMVKGDKAPRPGAQRIQVVGISKSPTGPFKFEKKPAISDFDTEDASLWYDKTRHRYYAVFHAHTHYGMITSKDGINWSKASHYHVGPKSFKMTDGKTFKGQRMERPSVFCNSQGQPTVFISSYKKGNHTGILTTTVKQKEMASHEELYTGKEYTNAFSNPTDNPTLPNILLIGDSISIGYTVEVRKRLKGKADVFRIPTNGRYSAYGLKNLTKWLGDKKWDLIHFNWGLWDLCYRNPKAKNPGSRDKLNGKLTATPKEYKKNIKKIVTQLKKTKAKLIWANTTPVPDFEIGRKKGDAHKYNLIATTIMKSNNIQVNDLHKHAKRKIKKIQKNKGDVHFNQKGYSYLAKKVVKEILFALKDK